MREVEELRETIAKNECEIEAFIGEVKQGQKKTKSQQ